MYKGEYVQYIFMRLPMLPLPRLSLLGGIRWKRIIILMMLKRSETNTFTLPWNEKSPMLYPYPVYGKLNVACIRTLADR